MKSMKPCRLYTKHRKPKAQPLLVWTLSPKPHTSDPQPQAGRPTALGQDPPQKIPCKVPGGIYSVIPGYVLWKRRGVRRCLAQTFVGSGPRPASFEPRAWKASDSHGQLDGCRVVLETFGVEGAKFIRSWELAYDAGFMGSQNVTA